MAQIEANEREKVREQALLDDFAGDIAIWLRVHTESRDWSSQTESVRGLAAHLVRVVENNR